jgi:hypothetical protein
MVILLLGCCRKMPKKKPNQKVHQNQIDTSPKAKVVNDISPNRSLARQPKIPIEEPKLRRIIKILRDDDVLDKIRDLAENGASLSTIDALLLYPPNTMSKLLDKGRAAKSNKDPYKKFFMLFRSWAGEARAHAELSLAKKSPEKWLDRNTSNKVIESEQDAQLAISAPSNAALPSNAGVDLKTVMSALKILREQGADINESIDKGEFKLYLGHDKELDDE